MPDLCEKFNKSLDEAMKELLKRYTPQEIEECLRDFKKVEFKFDQ